MKQENDSISGECIGSTRRRLRLACCAWASAILLLSPSLGVAASRIQFVDSGQRLGGNGNSLDVALGDVDGDGDLDAVVANSGSVGRTNFSQVWINQGGAQGGSRGTFVDSGQKLGTGFSRSVALGDLDGDGDLDAFFAEGSAQFTGGALQIWLNQGGLQGGVQGQFRTNGQVLPTSLAPTAVALDQLDGNPGLDAFVAITSFIGVASQVWANNGTGQFTNSGQMLGNGDGTDVALGDLEGDGDLDAFVAQLTGTQVWINQGGAQGGTVGVFLDSGQNLGGTFSGGVALGDLDGDTDLDAFVTTNEGRPDVWINQGGRQNGTPGTFVHLRQGFEMSDGRKIALGDLDGDGDLDAFVPSGVASRIYDNSDGEGQFTDSGVILFGADSSNAVGLGDLDGDGDLDAFVANSGGSNKVWLNLATRPVLFSTPPPGTVLYDLFVERGDPAGDRSIILANTGSNDLVIQSVSFLRGGVPGLGLGVVGMISTNSVSLPSTIRNASGSGLRIWVHYHTDELAGSFEEILEVISNDPITPAARYPIRIFKDGFRSGVFEYTISVLNSLAHGPDLAHQARAAAFTSLTNATFELSANDPHSVTSEIPSFLGGGSVVISNFTGRVTVSLVPIPNHPAQAALRVEAGAFTAPSFRLPSGIESGPNTFTFGPAGQSGGFLMLSNGSYTAFASATISNALFPEGIRVRGNYSGTYDAATGRASVASQSTDSFQPSDRLRFARTASDFWLSWLPGGLLEAAPNVLGPWTTLTNAASPYAIETTVQAQQFFRVRPNLP